VNSNSKYLKPIVTCVVLFQAVSAAYPEQSKYVSIFARQDLAASAAHYRDGAVNFEFDYPRTLIKVVDTEKDTIVKLSGVIDQKHTDFKLSKLEGAPEPKLAEQFVLANMQKGLPGCTLVARRDIRFGHGLTFSGSEQQFNFRLGDEPYTARVVIFSHRDQTFMWTFTCAVRDEATIKPFFDNTLASLRQQSAGSVSTRTVDNSLTFDEFNDSTKQISFDYPQGWKLERDPGKEFETKFRGSNKAGLGAELTVTRLERPPGYTLDQYFDTFEQTYLKPLKGYQKLSTTHSTFGITHHDGSLTSSTFTAEGHPCRQLTAFFAEGRYYYAIVLTGGIWSEREMRNVFDRILASFKLTD
jgi:hypothetical protein